MIEKYQIPVGKGVICKWIKFEWKIRLKKEKVFRGLGTYDL